MIHKCGKEIHNSGAYAPGLAPKCILELNHTGPHTDGEKQWNDSLESNFDIQKRESTVADNTRAVIARWPDAWAQNLHGWRIFKTPFPNHDSVIGTGHNEDAAWRDARAKLESMPVDEEEKVMRERFLEKCKPFAIGTTVYTSFGEGKIVDILQCSDLYCPFTVKCSDGNTRMFPRNMLSLNPANAPKTPVCICEQTPHHHECPVANEVVVPVPQTMQCDGYTLGKSKKEDKRCILQLGHKGECDYGSTPKIVSKSNVIDELKTIRQNRQAALEMLCKFDELEKQLLAKL